MTFDVEFQLDDKSFTLNDTSAAAAEAAAQRAEAAAETVSGSVAQIAENKNDISSLKEDLGDLSDLETADKSTIVAAINEAAQSGGGSGGITVVDTVAEMVDTEAVYLYNGTETGYTAGHWYYYDTGASAWTDGGEYTGWETVDTAISNFINSMAQEIGALTITVGDTTYTYNGSAAVAVTLPVYDGGVS